MKKISPISNYEKNGPAYYNHLPSDIPSTSALCDSIINIHTDLQDQSTENDVNEPTHKVENFNTQTVESTNNLYNMGNYTAFDINVVVETYTDIGSDEEVNNKKCSNNVAVEHFDPELPTTKQSLQNPDQTDLLSPAALQSSDVLIAVEQSDSASLAMEHSDSVLVALEDSDLALLAMEHSDSALLPLKTLGSPLFATVQSSSDAGECNPDMLSEEQINSPSNLPSNSIAGENEDCLFGENKKRKNRKKKRTSKKLSKDTKKEKKNAEDIMKIQALKRKSKAKVSGENSAKKKRGETYVNKDGEVVEGKRMKPNPCIGKKCPNNCESIPDDRREKLFKYFWDLGIHQRRKDWVAQSTIKKRVKRPDKNTSLNRSCAYEYYINENEGRRRVCQKFLINTLDYYRLD
ncbi:unnamed protein product [Diatraea saccharalis]|uniref:Uncharacterized protein n=1 Tax=Diatraea saccharalis TaxID=40085 RepID=A0A9N9WG21_9NEOP|nr:unnamed protein product [Diatraea saccharalis]